MTKNKLYIAAAGAGKTTYIINHAVDYMKINDGSNIGIITYTIKNQEKITDRIKELKGYVPNEIKVLGWYSFLLEYCIRPFMGSVIDTLYCKQVGLSFVEGVSGRVKNKGKYHTTYKANDLLRKFLTKDYCFKSDKLSEFAYLCYKKNKADFINRLSNIFSAIYIDEVQDLSAWDYDIITLLIKHTNLQIILCGDPRQKTFSTTKSSKWEKYSGGIDKYLQQEVNKPRNQYIYIDYTTLNYSHRFGTEIANFANLIIGTDFPPTRPCSCSSCKSKQFNFPHKCGVYLVKESHVSLFITTYNPMVLIWNSAHNQNVSSYTYTYGESKGLEEDVCLIYPTDVIVKNILKSKKKALSDLSRCKLYVAITRARYISAIVVENDFNNSNIGIPFWKD